MAPLSGVVMPSVMEESVIPGDAALPLPWVEPPRVQPETESAMIDAIATMPRIPPGRFFIFMLGLASLSGAGFPTRPLGPGREWGRCVAERRTGDAPWSGRRAGGVPGEG